MGKTGPGPVQAVSGSLGSGRAEVMPIVTICDHSVLHMGNSHLGLPSKSLIEAIYGLLH